MASAWYGSSVEIATRKAAKIVIELVHCGAKRGLELRAAAR